MFIILKELVDLSTAQCISETQIACMRHSIFEYLDHRVTLFPEVKLRPKHHYLTHYPHLMKQFGPLIRFWTMRFESKHSYFKNVIRHTRNFKNVPKTCTERHQYHQSLMSTRTSRFHMTHIIEPKNDAKRTYAENRLIIKNNFDYYKSHFLCEKIEFRGIIFKTLDIIYYSRNVYGEPIFAQIRQIFVRKDLLDVVFLLSEIPVYENKKFGIIEIEKDINPKLFLKMATDFLDLTIHYKYFDKTKNSTYICIKHAIHN